MTRIRIEGFTVSIDGYGAGPEQTLTEPMGKGAEALHTWLLHSRTFHRMIGREGGTTGEDERYAARGFDNVGAWVMGRNMFTHERGQWSDPSWKGWWGDVPPYHCDVFVLTHYPRDPLPHGGTTFHFVTEGLEAALDRARASAGGKDVRLGGGTSTVREALGKRLVDEMHIAVSPLLLGRGEAVWPGLDLPSLGYRMTEHTATDATLHGVWRRE